MAVDFDTEPDADPRAGPRRPATMWDAWSDNVVTRRVVAFVDRQTSLEITAKQVWCDVLCGAFLPLLLLWLDRAWDPVGMGGFVPFRPYPGAFAGLGAAAIVLFHIARRWLPWLATGTGGALLATGSIAGALSTLLLPLSLIGILAEGIGLLGLLPFVTVFCHVRCAIRSWRLGRGGFRRALFAGGAAVVVLGGLLGARGAKALALRSEAVVLGLRDGNRDRAMTALQILWLVPGVELPLIERQAWRDEGDLERFEVLWFEITGDSGLPRDWD